MLLFPNAKINIGLNVLSKREDGYHNLETLFYPLGLKDALEFVENHTNAVHLSTSGINLETEPQNNIILKAYHLLAEKGSLPGIDIHLHKAIPHGAGLGGGSSDAAFFMKGLNEFFELHLSKEELKRIAVRLGADCSFFIENKPALASGIGEVLTETDLNLKGYFLVLIKPPFGVNTREAYAGIRPFIPDLSLKEAFKQKPENWMSLVKNDFEPSVFKKYPEIALIKQALLDKGALYSAMSGSGSSVFGLFTFEPDLPGMDFPPDYFIWKEMF
jgi:4-diphosphocytidyl-2-C-methyl-D-erythritol kinase